MEKITLKPSIKELIYKNGEDNVHFDVLSYQGASGQEKMLGSLFVLGNIKYTEEDLAYAVSLISSLAKREYYSELSFQEQNAKSAFERTLKKLNEVLDDFFQNKDFKLDIGLAAISDENIYISRLGRFKIAMARDGKYIDVLNNVDLFNKDSEGEKQFSNIISGKLKPNDKIFAYFPLRPITSREKQLNGIFVKETQEEFGQKIAQLASNATNFSCCGVHIDMREIKEIPVSSATYAKPVLSFQAHDDMEERMPAKTKPKATTASEPRVIVTGDTKKEGEIESTNQEERNDLHNEQSRIIPAEFSISKRANIFTPIAANFKKIFSIGRIGNHARQRNFIIISAIVIVPIIIFILLKTNGSSNADKDKLKQASENLKLAQSRITQSNLKNARSLLQSSLISLTDISSKNAQNTKQQIEQALKGIDHISDKQPMLFTDPIVKNKDFKASLIAAASGNDIATIDTDGNLFAISQNDISKLNQFKTAPQFIFNASSVISAFNNSDIFDVYDMKSKKSTSFSLKNPVTAVDAVLYEGNLYTLSGNAIYKYADAVTGGIKRADWGDDTADGNLISLTSDGNIYALNSDGKIIKYFKGKKVSDFDLQLAPSSGSRIFTFKDSAFIYLADKTYKKVYIFDKANASLNTTFKLDATGTPQDISISPDGTIWILSSDNKVWSLK